MSRVGSIFGEGPTKRRYQNQQWSWRDMDQSQRAILIVQTNVEPEYDEEYNRWYNQDHMPSLLRCPGFIRGHRYVASTTYYPPNPKRPRIGRKYIQLYE